MVVLFYCVTENYVSYALKLHRTNCQANYTTYESIFCVFCFVLFLNIIVIKHNQCTLEDCR